MRFLMVLCGVLVVIGTAVWRWPAPHSRVQVITGYESVTIYGQVQRQGRYDWKPGMTVRSLLAEAGGFSQFANTKRVKVHDRSRVAGPLHRLHQWLHQTADRMDEALDELWDSLRLPGDTPQLDVSKPSPPLKAVVNFRLPHADAALDPEDVVIVDEMLVSF